MSSKVSVRDLKDKDTVQSLFLVRDKAVLNGKNGKTYIGLTLADQTGAVDARIWENVDAAIDAFQSGDVVKLRGLAQIYQGRLQVIVHKIEKAEPSEYSIGDFVADSARPAPVLFAELQQFVELISDAKIKQLVVDCMNDSEIRSRLMVAPAAKTVHHAYHGGLLEHIVSICGWMRFLHAHYEAQGAKLNLDYLIFGAIFHDIGKIWELDVSHGVTYTDKGKLLGHIIMAVELIEKKASRILGFPEETKDLLKHIVLSHHGRIEYGSPKTPVFLEAYLVAAIDDLDSKINTIDMFIRSEQTSGEKWSRYNAMFERYFLLRS